MDQATHNKIVSFIWGILAIEKEAEGLLGEITGGVDARPRTEGLAP